jgi:DNA-binding GntR family transcriptional regulator
VLEARREIERFLARSAAKRATPVQRVQFREIAAGMDDAARNADDIAFMRLDREFNLLVLDSAGNEFAAAAMSLMNGLSRRFWYVHYKQAADLPLAARLHATIARAIADADQDAAASSSDALVDYIRAFARATIG